MYWRFSCPLRVLFLAVFLKNIQALFFGGGNVAFTVSDCLCSDTHANTQTHSPKVVNGRAQLQQMLAEHDPSFLGN